MRHRVSLLLLLVVLMVIPTIALARSSGVQLSKDGKRIFINKDVGDERWAITLNKDDNTITGNVFHSNGGDPQFIWCQESFNDGQQVDAACWGADKCDFGPCTPSDWTFIANVTLPASFFALPDVSAPTPTPTPRPTSTPVATDSLAALIGTWNFTYTIISTFTDTFHLSHIETVQGTRLLVGTDQFGNPALAARGAELVPGSQSGFEFALLTKSSLICEGFVFNRTSSNAVSGIAYIFFEDSTGDCIIDTSRPHAMTGVRISTSALTIEAEAANTDAALVQARDRSLIREQEALERRHAVEALTGDGDAALLRELQRSLE